MNLSSIYKYLVFHFICSFLLHFFSLPILWQIYIYGDMTWIDLVVLACMGCNLILIFYYFFPLSYLYLFPHTALPLVFIFWCVQSYKYWDLVFFFKKNESHSLHAIRWLGLDECSQSYVNFVWEFWEVLCTFMFCHKIVKGKDC